jgi:hypothetical protein
MPGYLFYVTASWIAVSAIGLCPEILSEMNNEDSMVTLAPRRYSDLNFLSNPKTANNWTGVPKNIEISVRNPILERHKIRHH